MDELINALNNFGVTEQFGVPEQIDNDIEWEHLSKNYAKLIYIKHLIIKHNPNHPEFFNCLSNFINGLDSMAQHYIKEMTWYNDPDLEEYYEDSQMIRHCLEMALETSDILSKMHYLIEAYSTLVPIIEEFRRERADLDVEPEFKQSFKKRKIN